MAVAVLDGLSMVSAAAALVWPLNAAPMRARWRIHPGAALAAVIGLIYLNQVLFTVYVIRVRHGDTAFIARYLPNGWFALADRTPLMRTLAAYFPAPDLLAPTVLRVQAFLELPFVVLAYLTVCRWAGAGVYRRAVRLVRPAAVAWTATFCLIEWSLHNPYTTDDLVLRCLACLIVVGCVPFFGGGEGQTYGLDLGGLMAFTLSTAAFGYFVLVVYDTALLYNLRHVADQWPGALLALTVLGASRAWAGRRTARPPGRGLDTLGSCFGWFLVVFFVPALPVRYGLGFGARFAAVGIGVLILVVAVTRGTREVHARTPGKTAAWTAQLSAAACAALTAGAIAMAIVHGSGHTELSLLGGAAAAFLTATMVCAITDRSSSRAGPPDSPPTPPACRRTGNQPTIGG